MKKKEVVVKILERLVGQTRAATFPQSEADNAGRGPWQLAPQGTLGRRPTDSTGRRGHSANTHTSTQSAQHTQACLKIPWPSCLHLFCWSVLNKVLCRSLGSNQPDPSDDLLKGSWSILLPSFWRSFSFLFLVTFSSAQMSSWWPQFTDKESSCWTHLHAHKNLLWAPTSQLGATRGQLLSVYQTALLDQNWYITNILDRSTNL